MSVPPADLPHDRGGDTSDDAVIRDLAEQVENDLHDHGSTTAVIADLPVSPDTWRRLARAAARAMQRPMRTELMPDRINAFITDWPRESGERIRRRRYLAERRP